MLKIGDTIPDFTLDAFHEKKIKKIKLSSFKGQWSILLFYPADFTFVCPTELEDAAEKYADFKKIGAEIISISTDTAYAHKAWHDTSEAIGKVEYPMGADPAGQVCRAFGTYIDEKGLSVRTTYIIDPNQKVVAIDMHDNSIGRNIDEIYRKLQAAKFVYDHHGTVVCPAKWHPGEKTLKPGVELVGKI